MMKNDLLNFLRREYGDGYNELLEDLMRRNEINHLETEDKGKLRLLAKDVRDSLPTASITKRNILFSAIIRILRLDITDIGTDKISSDKEEKNRTIDELKVQKFVKNIEKSLTKYETIFNLFWLRAGEAEIEGIKHEEILKTTQKALIGIKKDLEKSRDEILAEYNLLERNYLKNKKNFHFKTGNLIEARINEKNENELKNKKIIKDIFNKFWNNVEIYYANFKKIFIESMEKDIEYKKQGKDDSLLISETKEKMIKIWSSLEESYKTFEKEIKEANKKID